MNDFNLEIRDLAGGRVLMKDVSARVQKRVLKKGFKDIKFEVVKGANDIRNSAIQGIRTSPKTGRRYLRGRTKKGKQKFHIASSPDFPPRTDSGALIKSIIMDQRIRLQGFEVEVGSIITRPPYPIYLEFGTGKMAARPWLEPAKLKHENMIIHNVGQAIRRAAADIAKGMK